MSQQKFQIPKGMKRFDKTPVTAEIGFATKEALEKAAEKHGLSFEELIANILEDYASWLKEPKKRRASE